MTDCYKVYSIVIIRTSYSNINIHREISNIIKLLKNIKFFRTK